VDATQIHEWSNGHPKRTPEEQRDFDEHNIAVAQIAMEHKESDQAALQLKATRTIQFAMRVSGIQATLKDHLSATKATNAQTQTYLVERFTSMNSGLFTELKTLVSNKAEARHQDQVDLKAGLAELRTVQAHLAENTGRLFDYQRQTLHVNERILESQDDALKNTERLASVLDPDNHPLGEQPVSRSMLHEMFGEWTT
jgi:hypothetical protein